jgi:hypothetical protein
MKRNIRSIGTVFLIVASSCVTSMGWGIEVGRTRAAAFTSPAISQPIIQPVAADGTVDVTVEVESATETLQREGKPVKVTSGVYDLRLFRDGQLVGSSIPKAAVEKYISAAPAAVARDIADGKVLQTDEDALWRTANDLFKVSSPELKMVSPTKAVYTFHNIQLPRDGRKEVEFSAYAFNTDRVKSDTARTEYLLPSLPAPAGKKAYIISVGVNTSDLADWHLRFAAKDAEVTQKALADRLIKQYEVVPVLLVSDAGNGSTAARKNAIKPNIRTALELLSGVAQQPADLARLSAAIGGDTIKKLVRSTPQDMVVITFSSHGFADPSGNFYLLPSDLRISLTEPNIPERDSMISSDELSLWMRDLDASDAVMIVDACYAASSVTGTGFKPAPMGSRGLGQLAYDKQMRILTATREKDAAVEIGGDVKEGLLTYALVKEGLGDNMADHKPKPDGKLYLSEWLEFAQDEVPVIFEKLEKGELKGSKGVPFASAAATTYLQRPALFDFRRKKDNDIQLIQ